MNKCKKRWCGAVCLSALLIQILSGCGTGEGAPDPSAPTEDTSSIVGQIPAAGSGEEEAERGDPDVEQTFPLPEQEPELSSPESILAVADREALKKELKNAIIHLRRSVRMDISQVGLTDPCAGCEKHLL